LSLQDFQNEEINEENESFQEENEVEEEENGKLIILLLSL